MGVDPGTEPLDADCTHALPAGERDPGRIDHFAIHCELALRLD